MDGCDTLHLPRLLSDPSVWNNVLRFCRSVLLDKSYHGIQQGYIDGTGDFPNCHIKSDHAGVYVYCDSESLPRFAHHVTIM